MKSNASNQNLCDSVAERIALGEPTGELAEHIASCERCKQIVDLPTRLGATRTPIDPGLGFSARMTAGAQHRLVVRRRRRIAAGVIGTMAAGVLGVFLFTRTPEADQTAAVTTPYPPVEATDDAQPQELSNEELAVLVRLADTQRSRKLSANWKKIQRPLAPYRDLVTSKDVTP